MPNRLALEKSPYLLQHMNNPVDWHPWGEEAFDKAKSENKPVFLSVGYATCHWCHVMAHESFEDQEVARVLNRDFVPIKVDREERPDVDSVYMTVCQGLTGSGGWPLSVFLTPQGKPFFAGTYFPKEPLPGHPGFLGLCREIARRWKESPEELAGAADQVTLAVRPKPIKERQELDRSILEKAYWQLAGAYDPKWGGFGQAPKFPTPHHLNFLLRWHLRHPESRALEMVRHSLTSMRQGGVFDHLGKGFHRYSVDERWLVPHFEKMLYDQALLALAYLETYQLTKDEFFADAARDIFSYVMRDMTSGEGGFFAAEDADSEGREGAYYVWTPESIAEVLEPELAGLVRRYYGVINAGNFEHGESILWEREGLESFAEHDGIDPAELKQKLEEAGARLFEARIRRKRPLLDDKVLTAWNGLMIAALALGYQALGDRAYLEAASRAAEFVWRKLRDGDGRLMRRIREGQTAGPGFMDDYAFYTFGLIELYQAGLDPLHLERALQLQDDALARFWDELHWGFYFTTHDGEKLIIREKDLYDGALPSANSVAAMNLLRLARLTGRADLESKAWQLMQCFSRQMSQQPMACTQMLLALDYALARASEVVLAGGEDTLGMERMLSQLHRPFTPHKVWLAADEGEAGRRLVKLAPFVKGMQPVDGKATAYVCHGNSCQNPITDPGGLEPGQAI